MTARVVRQGKEDPQHLERLVEEYRKSKELLERIEKRQNEMKKQLTQAIDDSGFVDDKGHKWLKVGSYELKRERRVSRSFDTAQAEQWARENGLWDKVKEVLEVLSEEKLLALAWEDKSLNEVVSSFYIEKETWAFKA
jgi:hypothetical protein